MGEKGMQWLAINLAAKQFFKKMQIKHIAVSHLIIMTDMQSSDTLLLYYVILLC